jgi:outer membrane lipoprotein-sorting protein
MLRRLFMASILTCLAGLLAVRAEEVPPPAQETLSQDAQRPSAEPAPVTGDELDRILSGIQERQKEIQGFKADFQNEKQSGLVVEVVKSSGRLVFVKPNHFFREVKGDEPVITVLHNDELLIYFPKDRKAERYFLKKETSKEKTGEKGKGQEDVDSMLAGLSFDRKKLEERFKITAFREPAAAGTAQAGLVRVNLVPLKPDDPMLKYLVRVTLWTDEKSPWPVTVETENPDGDISKDTLSNVEDIKTEDTNKVLKEVFEFKLPRGVKVMMPQK